MSNFILTGMASAHTIGEITEKAKGQAHMVIFDLEWNRGYDKNPLNEVLQIGAVKLEHLGGPVLDVFDAYIRPRVHGRFDVGASALPELKAYRSRGRSFGGAMDAFRAWCAGETVFASWGTGDLDTLKENCDYWHVPFLEVEKVYDLQVCFAHMLGTDQSIALWRAVDYCGIPDTFTYHNARNDALYTALVGAWLTPEALAYVPPTKEEKLALKFCAEPFPRQSKRRVGPQPTPEQVLDAREGRKPPCPHCGKSGVVNRWSTAGKRLGQGQYFGVFTCPVHGRFLCRLTLTQQADGAWSGRRSVPALTPDLLREYAAALKGHTHQCRGGGRRHRYRRRPAKECPSPAAS